MSVTLKQLADEAGVSQATISLALNGSNLVAQKTRTRILSIAKRMKYEPNMVARSLAGCKTKLLGILLDSGAPQAQFRMCGLIEREAALHGYRTMIGEGHNSIDELYQNYSVFKQYRAAGVICVSHEYHGDEDKLNNLFGECNDIVYIGKPRLPHASYLAIDRSMAIRQAVSHLRENGFSKIGLMGTMDRYDSEREKADVFCAALREAGVDNPEQYLISIAFEDPAQGMEEIYEKFVRTERIDALLAGNDTQAAILSKILRRNNLKVPNDFGLIGFDDEPFCEYMNPSISSIDDELQLQAKLIVRLMMEMIEDEESNPIDRTVTVRSRLVVRDSSRKEA